MTRENKYYLHQQILSMVQYENPLKLFSQIECMCCGFTRTGYIIEFTARQIAPYITKKLGYYVRIEEIKHALKPIKEDDYFCVRS
jgi:hypothetical protein